METINGVTYYSPFETWKLPKKDMSKVKEAVCKKFEYYCPNCGEKLPLMEDEYEVDGNMFPQYFNEYLLGTPDGPIHDWDELHCCPNCKTECYFRDGI